MARYITHLGLFLLLDIASGGILLDMTHSFDNTSLYWPNGQASFQLKILHKGQSENGYWYQGDEYCSGIHLGTHMDAPGHFYKDRWLIDEIPLDLLVSRPAVRIDIRQKVARSPDFNVTLEDVKLFEGTYGQIARGAVVVQCSGWSDRYPDVLAVFGNDRHDTADYHFPGFSLEAVEFLINERGIVALAVDTPSIDYGQADLSFPVHTLFSSHNVYSLENVKDTCKLPPAGATMTCLPSKIRGASGAPVRIFATWDSSTGQMTNGERIILLFPLCLVVYLAI